MKIEKDNENLTLTSPIKQKLIYILPLVIGIWFIVVFFYGIWYSSIVIGEALVLNPYSFVVLINLFLAVAAYCFFGPVSFLITIGSISSILKLKRITISRSEINVENQKYLFLSKNFNMKTTDVIELKTTQDETSEFCQLLAITKSGESIEIENDDGLNGMKYLNDLAQEIFNFLNEIDANSLNIKLTRTEFIPFIDEEEEKSEKKGE